ncbi:hypothetical protein H257_09277 [Aphanomyces astaci]|uniref:Golgin subfamily A member 7/ERF4 domain-containing protein n=1 Tax=Aphanomyces astaci TaxID=112090 RepID=W4GCZ5_APHAT|nr:hypothetical protein H257_09277 [Aphanomyces astaci]ETV76833.1 hypothetical protein H257_09277 [Aphanomyces astaci]|eukprot:XP_009833745.1 hypothetical protein H257_09277 [Aphanomyces astaci]
MSREHLLGDDDESIVLARLGAVGSITIDGWSSAYDDAYPKALKGVVPPNEFHTCITAINQSVDDYYPCIPCFGCGYLCCVASFGLSLLVPQPCTTELEKAVEFVLHRINGRDDFLYRGIVWKVVRPKHTHTSWIELRQLAC